jgi:hypothetical protein
MRACAWAISCLVFAAPLAAADGWGNLKGRFVYDGDPARAVPAAVPGKPIDESLVVDPASGGVANIVVWVRRPEKVEIHPDLVVSADRVDWQCQGSRLDPHVVALRTGQELVVKNKDAFGHSFVTSAEQERPFGAVVNSIVAAGESVKRVFQQRETLPVKIGCNIHPWLEGWIVVRDNPYVAISAADGSFELAKLPAGELEFQFWHEKAGWLEAKPEWRKGRVTLNIAADETTDLGTVRLNPAVFKPAK